MKVNMNTYLLFFFQIILILDFSQEAPQLKHPDCPMNHLEVHHQVEQQPTPHCQNLLHTKMDLQEWRLESQLQRQLAAAGLAVQQQQLILVLPVIDQELITVLTEEHYFRIQFKMISQIFIVFSFINVLKL